jgi:hypothetical protein
MFDHDDRRLLYKILANQSLIISKLNSMDNTIDDVLADVQQESTVEDSLVTLTTAMKAQLTAALAGTTIPADVQAKIDLVFSGIEANKTKVAAAVTANT